MADELFSLGDKNSLVRKVWEAIAEINIKEFDLKPYKIPEDYEVNTHQFSEEKYGREIRSVVEPLAEKAENFGYSSNLFTAMYEAIKNAHEHGNKKDPEKKVTVGHKITPTGAAIIISDEGGVLDSQFANFILEQRISRSESSNFLDWYKFSDREKPRGNLGTGTSFIHAYSSDVRYYMSEDGGITIAMAFLNSK